jgi:hypothetical protein
MDEHVDWWDAPRGGLSGRPRSDEARREGDLPEEPEGLLYPELFRTAELELAALQRFTAPSVPSYRPMEAVVAYDAALTRDVERAWYGDFQEFVRQLAMDSAIGVRYVPDDVLQALFALASNHGQNRAVDPHAVRLDQHTFLRRGYL